MLNVADQYFSNFLNKHMFIAFGDQKFYFFLKIAPTRLVTPDSR